VELLYLGTAAAEGYPALFCSCDHCRAAREAGGRDLRRRTAALIDGELLIDVGPDLLASAHALNLSLDRVRWVLQTHGHSDHLLESNFNFREQGFTGTTPEWWELCGSQPTIDAIAAYGRLEQKRLTLRAVTAFETFSLGPYTVTALRARHDMRIDPLFYAIRRGESALLWANDTGAFFPETWQALDQLAAEGVRFGMVGIEATVGTQPTPNADQPGGHMNIEQCGWHHQELGRRGLLTAGAQRFAQHMSHHKNPLHAELAELLRPYGVTPAYDGLRVDVGG
jgi:phosphoribosyl 1,2-cyclic phosphate phosphodiesterase